MLKTLSNTTQWAFNLKTDRNYRKLHPTSYSRSLILAFLIVTNIQAHALTKQEENPWSVGLNFSPNYTYRTLADNENRYYSFTVVTRYSEVASYGFNTGLTLRYKLPNSFSLESGLSYAYHSYRTIPYPYIYDNNPDNYKKQIRFIYNNNFIELPIRIIYTGKSSKNNLTFSAGFINQISFKNSTFLKSEEENTKIESFLNRSSYDIGSGNISATMSVGYLFRKSKIISFHIEPSFRHQLFNNSQSYTDKRYLWSTGLQIGMYYKLK